ncbi:glycosyltransferase [Massilia sp. IC2-477]|uniref:glycosyltransferase n=1 Tax=Massilia sp. IC2-477 TaxID=2887198 RepID=UPI001D10441D|nr:glycosyltransferase [Massilia sp. IC2-477]
MVDTVLMVAFHFPPQRGSSGIQRTVSFARYLPELGWRPLVLSAHPRAYADAGGAPYDGPAQVTRAFALDSARHLAIKGRYTRMLALPDRWIGWLPGAVRAGLRLVRRERPAVIWSTYPIATAHLIGLVLHRLTGLPWVADLRDPMIDASWPQDPWMRRAAAWVERRTLRHCARAVCATSGMVRSYRQRYPELPPERFCLIENGYDEAEFTAATADVPRPVAAPDRPFVLLHSGIVYPSERDPGPLFAALAGLARAGVLDPARFRLRLRAPVHDALLKELAREHGIDALVEIAPPLPYRAALAEMLAADGLLVLQAANCNNQVPAKLYEYLRAGRPLLALTDPAGDTAALVRAAGIDTMAPLDDREAIAQALTRLLELARRGSAPCAAPEFVRAQARSARARQLASLLADVASEARSRRAGT